MTITIALAILGIFLSITFNLNNFVSKMESGVEVTAFLEDQTDGQAVMGKIRKLTGVQQVHLISKEGALAEFAEDKDLKELIDIIGVNPLPASVLVKINREGLERQKVARLVKQLELIKGVEEVRYGRQWLGQLFDMLQLLRKISLVIGLTLSVAVLFIISNTIRLTVYLNADKIIIMRLVGATDNFIRGPYLIQGIIQGCLGGVVAVGLLKAGFYFIFPEQSGIIFLPRSLSSVIIIIGVVLGGGASFVAVRKFLPVTFR